MVFFACNSCGTSVKKNQVEKHGFSCGGRVYSCIDCNKDFVGDAYKKHTQCVSEDQKYGGTGYKPKEGANKGRTKQEQWLECVKQAVAGSQASPQIKQMMEQIVAYENIPRKKPKFMNFARNSLRGAHDSKLEQVWLILESAMKAEKAAADSQNEGNQNQGQKRKAEDNELEPETEVKKEEPEPEAEAEEEPKPQRKKKVKKVKKEVKEEDDEEGTALLETKGETLKQSEAKSTGDGEENVAMNGNGNGNADHEETLNGKETNGKKFKWMKTIKAILGSEPEKEMSVKKLRKMVIAVYKESVTKKQLSEEELKEKVEQLVTNSKNLTVEGKRVKMLPIQ